MDLCDLRTTPWIPVCEEDGFIHEIGVVEIIRRAHELRRIEGNDPLQTVSLYRMLVGLAHHLVGEMENESDWAEVWQPGRFDSNKVDFYFSGSSWTERFRLFDQEYPFWQFPRLTNIDPKTGQPRPVLVSTLMHEVASGNNKTLFSHRLDREEIQLTPAQAARTLVTAQFFSVGGLNKKTTDIFGYQESYFHAPFVNGMPSFVIRENLFETLMVNTLPKSQRRMPLGELPLGVPPWAEDESTIADKRRCAAKGPGTPTTYLEYFLPRSRHIRLLMLSEPDGHTRVGRLHIAQGVAWQPDVEPWFARTVLEKDGSVRPLQLDVDRAVWRESSAYLGWYARNGRQGAKPPDSLAAYNLLRKRVHRSRRRLGGVAQISVCALANDKAKPLTWRQERLDLPVEAMEDRAAIQSIDAALDVAEQVGFIVKNAVRRFHSKLFGDGDGGRDSMPARKAATDATARTYWAALEQPFRKVLNDQSEVNEFKSSCERLARQCFDRFAATTVGSNVSLFPALAEARRYLHGALRKMSDSGPQSDREEAKR